MADPPPLERLRNGEIDVETYLDIKVRAATAHLVGLSRDELLAIQAILRKELAEDPELVALVAQVAREVPTKH